MAPPNALDKNGRKRSIFCIEDSHDSEHNLLNICTKLLPTSYSPNTLEIKWSVSSSSSLQIAHKGELEDFKHNPNHLLFSNDHMYVV
jgi:hypothetical protein